MPSTEFFLKKLLQNPSEQNYSELINFISNNGYTDFIGSLTNNNTLSIIFLKNYVQKWIDLNILKKFYDHNFIMFLLQSCLNGNIKNNNLIHVAGYIEILSNNYLISSEILKYLLEQRSNSQNVFIFIDAIFKKYTLHPRSNQLFTEINTSIELFFPVFIELFFSSNTIEIVEKEYQKVLLSAQRTALGETNDLIRTFKKPKLDMNQEYILSIFYSLTYQDIHPLFEDNIQHFFKIFFILFDQNQIIINEIFDLFISKYPEITNFDLIILTISRIDTLDGISINTLTNAYNYSRTFPAIIIGYLKRTLAIVPNEDWLAITQNLVRGNDLQRGFTHSLIRLLGCNPNLFEGEVRFFIGSVLRFKEQWLIDEALGIVHKDPYSNCYNDDTSYVFLAFTAFRYLLTIHHYTICHIGYLETNAKYISMKLCSNYLKSNDHFHRDSLVMEKHSSDLKPIDINLPLFNIKNILFLLNSNLDEFSAELLFRVVKNNNNLLTVDLYNFLLDLFKNLIKIPLTTLVYLFDIFIILSLKFKKYNLELVQTILNEEMIDFYNLCFLYLSVLIKETTIKNSLILQILSNDELWKTRELQFGLSFILISAYEKNIINKSQIEGIIPFLEGYCRILVLNRINIQVPGNYKKEEEYLVSGIFDGNWFLENFIDKKYVRLVLKKMVKDFNISMGIKQSVIEKNILNNIEYECTLHSIICYFDC